MEATKEVLFNRYFDQWYKDEGSTILYGMQAPDILRDAIKSFTEYVETNLSNKLKLETEYLNEVSNKSFCKSRGYTYKPINEKRSILIIKKDISAELEKSAEIIRSRY